MVEHKTDDEDSDPRSQPSDKSPAGDGGRASPHPEQKSRDIDLERVLYDPEYRQAVQESLTPDDQAQAGRSSGKKPQKG